MELGHWGRSHDAQVQGLQNDMKEWYKATGDKTKIQGELTFSRIRTSGDWPKLKAKAAATRHLVSYAYYLSVLYCDEKSTHDKRRRWLCELMAQFYSTLDSEGRYLSKPTQAEISELGKNLFQVFKKQLNRY